MLSGFNFCKFLEKKKKKDRLTAREGDFAYERGGDACQKF